MLWVINLHACAGGVKQTRSYIEPKVSYETVKKDIPLLVPASESQYPHATVRQIMILSSAPICHIYRVHACHLL